LLRVVTSGDGPPIAAAGPIFSDLTKELAGEMMAYQHVLATDLPAFNTQLKRAGLDPVSVNKPVVF
jgi:hypothetical protein